MQPETTDPDLQDLELLDALAASFERAQRLAVLARRAPMGDAAVRQGLEALASAQLCAERTFFEAAS